MVEMFVFMDSIRIVRFRYGQSRARGSTCNKLLEKDIRGIDISLAASVQNVVYLDRMRLVANLTNDGCVTARAHMPRSTVATHICSPILPELLALPQNRQARQGDLEHIDIVNDGKSGMCGLQRVQCVPHVALTQQPRTHLTQCQHNLPATSVYLGSEYYRFKTFVGAVDLPTRKTSQIGIPHGH